MAYYRICPRCGCSLDPGEICDCESEEAQQEAVMRKLLVINQKTGQMQIRMEPEREERRNACV